MKHRLVFVAVFSFVLVLILSTPALAFTDVEPGATYAEAITGLSDRGIVSGFEDGTFRPGEVVKRMQFAKMIVKTLELDVPDEDTCPFPDVPSGIDSGDPLYARHYVAVCAAGGITLGKTATTFAPYDPITRQQLITMVTRAAGLPDPPADYTPEFAPGQFSLQEHYLNACKAGSAGLLAGLQEVGPGHDFLAPASRGECAQLLHNLLAYKDTVPFSMTVIPKSLRGDSIPGQDCVFLVTVAEKDGEASAGPVALSAMAPRAEIVITPQEIVPGQVAEVTVTPEAASVGTTLEVVIQGTRDGATLEERVSFAVAEGEDDRAVYAAQLLDRFVSWLAAERPDLGITADTEWRGTMVSPVWLVVSHYLFFSENWEIHVAWHVMIAPDDWARIDLRRRFSETKPSLAFEISSVSAEDEPQEMEVPEEIWR